MGGARVYESTLIEHPQNAHPKVKEQYLISQSVTLVPLKSFHVIFLFYLWQFSTHFLKRGRNEGLFRHLVTLFSFILTQLTRKMPFIFEMWFEISLDEIVSFRQKPDGVICVFKLLIQDYKGNIDEFGECPCIVETVKGRCLIHAYAWLKALLIKTYQYKN